MKLILLVIVFFGCLNLGFSQTLNQDKKTEPSTFENVNISKRFFDFSKCSKGNYNKCFQDITPEQIFNFIGVSSTKEFKNQVYNQTKNYIIANIDEEIFLSALNNNHIKFEKPYLNISFWVNGYGKPNVNFFGSNVSDNKNVTKKLKFIISQINYNKGFHPEFEKLRNKQVTLFIPIGKKGNNYIIDPRTEEEKEFNQTKVKNTFPPYFKSCNGLEGTTEFTTLEKKEGIKTCMKHQYKSFLRNNFKKEIIYKAIKTLKETHRAKKPKFKVFASFKIDENGKACDYQALSIFPSIEKEVLRLIQKLPVATPATLNGKKVKYKFRLPIGFY